MPVRVKVDPMGKPIPNAPLLERGDTQMAEPPYRVGKSVVFRVPFTRTTFVVGWWGRSMDEEEALYRALGGVLRHRDDVHARVKQQLEESDDALVA
jgi:hypothetical protein